MKNNLSEFHKSIMRKLEVKLKNTQVHEVINQKRSLDNKL